MSADNSDHEPTIPQPKRPGFGLRLIVLVLLLTIAAGFFVFYRDQFRLAALAEREAALRQSYQAQPALALLIAFVLYVVVTGLSLPGAAAMSVLYGWLFGFWRALVLVSFASTSGATIAFLLSRYLFGQVIQDRYAERLATFNAAIDREGAYYLFTLRLIPQVPFFVLNAVMGLTRIRTRTFWWVSQLGMLPGTCVFVLAGASAPSLTKVAESGLSSLLDWKLIAALVLLGIVPLAIKKLLSRPYAHQSGSG
ncbi:MAG: TVP38/TMEM64 family protein [Pirellulaceae bacterium]